ncbi:Uncharacterised protein [Mycobacteroides abscessus subsp. abscessus]|nr:Uncharacterised protein [Mycobacteroides abscessus subsp. abscessus]
MLREDLLENGKGQLAQFRQGCLVIGAGGSAADRWSLPGHAVIRDGSRGLKPGGGARAGIGICHGGNIDRNA